MNSNNDSKKDEEGTDGEKEIRLANGGKEQE